MAALKKIKAATLVETLVSLTIISLSAGLAIIIFWQVSSPRSSARSLLLAQQESAERMENIISEIDSFGIEDRLWETSILNYEQRVVEVAPDLRKIIIVVRDNMGKPMYTRTRLIYVKGQRTK